MNKEGTGGRAISAVPMAHAQRFKQQQQQQQQPYSAISSPTTASAAAVASVPAAAKVSEPEEQAVPLASAPHT